MAIKIWERLRGYDHWIPAEATIESSQMQEHEFKNRGNKSYEYDAGDVLVWTDREGNRRTGLCRVPDDSPLYQYVGGEKIAILYNPEKPDEFYFPDLAKARFRHNLRQVSIAALLLSLIVFGTIIFTRVFK